MFAVNKHSSNTSKSVIRRERYKHMSSDELLVAYMVPYVFNSNDIFYDPNKVFYFDLSEGIFFSIYNTC